MASTYKIVFTGRMQPGFSLDDVVANLAATTTMDSVKARKFLTSGQPTVVKKGLEQEAAEAFGARLVKAGLEVQVVGEGHEIPSEAAPPPFAGGAITPAAPEYSAGLEVDLPGDTWLETPQQVGASHGWQWIVAALAMFGSEPWKWLAMVFLAGLLSLSLNIIPFVGSLCTMLLGPVLGGGMMMAARDQQEGRTLSVATLFRGFSRNRNQLLLVGALYMGAWVIWGLIFLAVMGLGVLSAVGFGDQGPQAVTGELVNNLPVFILLMLVSLALSIPALMAYWFAAPLVALADRTAWNAYKQSFSACLKNWLPFLVYGLVLLVVGILALIGFSALTALLAFLAGGDNTVLAVIATMGLAMLAGIPLMAVITLSLYTGFQDIFRRRLR